MLALASHRNDRVAGVELGQSLNACRNVGAEYGQRSRPSDTVRIADDSHPVLDPDHTNFVDELGRAFKHSHSPRLTPERVDRDGFVASFKIKISDTVTLAGCTPVSGELALFSVPQRAAPFLFEAT